jgi:hypothetical protein
MDFGVQEPFVLFLYDFIFESLQAMGWGAASFLSFHQACAAGLAEERVGRVLAAAFGTDSR